MSQVFCIDNFPGVDSVMSLDLFCTPVVVKEEPAPEHLCGEAATEEVASSHCVVWSAGAVLTHGNVCSQDKTKQIKTK